MTQLLNESSSRLKYLAEYPYIDTTLPRHAN